MPVPGVRHPLVVAVAQPLCVADDVAVNAMRHAATVRHAAARVVVFPELSLTGYELDAQALTADDPRLSPIIDACADADASALVGAPVRDEEGRSYIATLAVDSTGARVAYRKMWLGAAESERFTPGTAPAVHEVGGWRLGLAICKDTGVAQHAADTVALGVDVYVAGIVHAAHEAALQVERARRIAAGHHIPVAMAGFAGPTGGGYAHTAGRSGVWASGGVVVAQAGPEPGAIARATLTWAASPPRSGSGPGV